MFCDLYACIKLFISNNLRIYDVRRYYRFESRTHREKKSWFILNQDFLFHISGKIKKREHAVLGTFPSIV